ncbi:MAG: hypothetical protein A3F68_04450 [Acidobacteria bacterium RIFCSPLOWO2_12_FULL_54_10]|nr:MAG: hypothetical protein A3F68_04450 [Acidobacteria bacterium RIFCSPLOWO2_12_FULL_54_10]
MLEPERSSGSSGRRSVISVFGSGTVTNADAAYELARNLGAALSKKNYAVATGGYGGLMEAVSQGAAENGGHVIGVTASAISNKTNPWVHQQITVDSWEQRLHRLIAIGDGYVACPGGTGTLAELAVVWEMLNKGLVSDRPLVILGDFWNPVVEHVEFSEKRARGMVRRAETVAAAVDILSKTIAFRIS